MVVLSFFGCASNDAFEPGDICPQNDVGKTEPGDCGCFVADVDANGNTISDCLETSEPIPSGLPDDLCPNDENKTDPGVCGCGIPDDDSNGDGLIDCLDVCPDDDSKVLPGICGCGIPDDDLDKNGIPDCLEENLPVDLCPDNPDRMEPGVCGCDYPAADDEIDNDDNGIIDCLENQVVENECIYQYVIYAAGDVFCGIEDEAGIAYQCLDGGELKAENCAEMGMVCESGQCNAAPEPKTECNFDDGMILEPGSSACLEGEVRTCSDTGVSSSKKFNPESAVCKDGEVTCFYDDLIIPVGTVACSKDEKRRLSCEDGDVIQLISQTNSEINTVCRNGDWVTLQCEYQGAKYAFNERVCDGDNVMVCADVRIDDGAPIPSMELLKDCAASNEICDAGKCEFPRGCEFSYKSLQHGEQACFNNLIIDCQNGVATIKEDCRENMCAFSGLGVQCMEYTPDVCIGRDEDQLIPVGVSVCSPNEFEIMTCVKKEQADSYTIDLEFTSCEPNQICGIKDGIVGCVDRPLVYHEIETIHRDAKEFIDQNCKDSTSHRSAYVDIHEAVVTAIDTDGFFIQDLGPMVRSMQSGYGVFVSHDPTGLKINDVITIRSDAVGQANCRLQIMSDGDAGVLEINKLDYIAGAAQNEVALSEILAGESYDDMLDSSLVFINMPALALEFSGSGKDAAWKVADADNHELLVSSHFIDVKDLMKKDNYYNLTGIVFTYNDSVIFAPRLEDDIKNVLTCTDVNNKAIFNDEMGCKSSSVLSYCSDGAWVDDKTCRLGCDAETLSCNACTDASITCDGNIAITCVTGAQPVESTCSGTKSVCAADKGCVACVDNTNCPTSSVCDTSTNTCVGCVADTDCTSALPACNTLEHVCVECNTDTNCTDPAKPACNTTSHACVECTKDADCADGSTCLSNKCSIAPASVGCSSNSECIAKDSTKPICDSTTHACRACKSGEACPI